MLFPSPCTLLRSKHGLLMAAAQAYSKLLCAVQLFNARAHSCCTIGATAAVMHSAGRPEGRLRRAPLERRFGRVIDLRHVLGLLAASWGCMGGAAVMKWGHCYVNCHFHFSLYSCSYSRALPRLNPVALQLGPCSL